MITWIDVQNQQQRDTIRAAASAVPNGMALKQAISTIGSVQNPTGNNLSETLDNPGGDPYLRPSRNTIGVGVLGD